MPTWKELAAKNSPSWSLHWTAIGSSTAAHALLVCGVWWYGTFRQEGPRIALSAHEGTSSAIAVQASFAVPSRPVVEVLPEPDETKMLLELESPRDGEFSTERRRVSKRVQAEEHPFLPSAPNGLLPRPRPPASRMEPRTAADAPRMAEEHSHQQPSRAPSLPSPGSVPAVEDLGVRTRRLPTRKTAPPLIYPPEALRAGIEGVVEVLVSVDAQGKVTRVELHRSSGHRVLDEAAMDWVPQWRFDVESKWFVSKPAIRFRVPVRFDILSADQ